MVLNLGLGEVEWGSITFSSQRYLKVNGGIYLGCYWAEARDAKHSEMNWRVQPMKSQQ